MVFFPTERAVPDMLRTPTFVMRQLREVVAPLDYEAYMASPDVIRIHSGGHWPVDGYTLADEQRELALHEERHRARRDFAYILLDLDKTIGLGCVYVLPLLPFLRHAAAPETLVREVTDATAIITFWVRQDRQQTALAEHVITAVHSWLLAEWPFDDQLFRVNRNEHASIAALQQCGFRVRFEVILDEPPYHYFFFGKPAA